MITGKIFYFISASLLLLLSLVITFKGEKNKEKSRFFLVGYFWTAFLTMFVSIVNLYHYGAYFPFLIRVGMLISGFLLPLSYFYTLQILKPRSLRWSDLLHFLPALFFAIDYLPFYLMPAAQKIEIMQNLNPTDLMVGFSEGQWLPTYGHFTLRMVQVAFYCLAQVWLIRKAAQNPQHPVYIESRSVFNWLKILVGSQFFFFTGPLVSAIFWDVNAAGLFMHFCFFGFTAVQAGYLFFHPEILYDISDYFKPETEKIQAQEELASSVKYPEGNANKSDESNGGIEFTDAQITEYTQRVSSFFNQKKPFTQSNYRLKDFSGDLQMPAYLVSAFLNQVYGKNFNEFINDYRVEYLEELVQQDPTVLQYTLEAMGKLAGFNSRSVFINAVKRKKGKNPSEYFKAFQPIP